MADEAPKKKKKTPKAAAAEGGDAQVKKKKKKKKPAAENTAMVAYDPEAAENAPAPASSKKKKKAPVAAPAPVPEEKKAPKKSKTKLSRFNDEEEDAENDSRRRIFFIAAACCCCILIILILGLVLGLTLRDKGDDNNTNSASDGTGSGSDNSGSGGGGSGTINPAIVPTQAPVPLTPSVTANLPTPTQNPTEASPTEAPAPTPTQAPIPTPAPIQPPTSLLDPTGNLFVLLPTADTTVYLDGFDDTRFSSYGQDATFVVQNGRPEVNEVPDAVGIIAFDLDEIPGAIPLGSIQSITLQLFHEAHSRRSGGYPIRVRRLPWRNLFVESLTNQVFAPEDTEGIAGTTVNVNADDTIVSWDVTSLILNANLGDADRDPSRIFLMMEAVGPDQERGTEGDSFFTRETFDPPQLLIRY